MQVHTASWSISGLTTAARHPVACSLSVLPEPQYALFVNSFSGMTLFFAILAYASCIARLHKYCLCAGIICNPPWHSKRRCEAYEKRRREFRGPGDHFLHALAVSKPLRSSPEANPYDILHGTWDLNTTAASQTQGNPKTLRGSGQLLRVALDGREWLITSTSILGSTSPEAQGQLRSITTPDPSIGRMKLSELGPHVLHMF